MHKAGVALKELREARDWVVLVQKTEWIEDDFDAVVGEADELCAILGASIRTARVVISRSTGETCAEQRVTKKRRNFPMAWTDGAVDVRCERCSFFRSE